MKKNRIQSKLVDFLVNLRDLTMKEEQKTELLSKQLTLD